MHSSLIIYGTYESLHMSIVQNIIIGESIPSIHQVAYNKYGRFQYTNCIQVLLPAPSILDLRIIDLWLRTFINVVIQDSNQTWGAYPTILIFNKRIPLNLVRLYETLFIIPFQSRFNLECLCLYLLNSQNIFIR